MMVVESGEGVGGYKGLERVYLKGAERKTS